MAGKYDQDLVMSFWGKVFTDSRDGSEFTKYTTLDAEGHAWEIKYNHKKHALIAEGATDQDTKPDFFLFKTVAPVARARDAKPAPLPPAKNTSAPTGTGYKGKSTPF